MRKKLLTVAGVGIAATLTWALGIETSRAQIAAPERQLVNIRLGRSYRDVQALYGGPNEILTVSVPSSPGQPGMQGMPGMSGMPGGDAGMFGGGMGMSDAGAPGMMGAGGSGGFFGDGGATGGGGFAAPGFGGSGGFAGMAGGGGFGGPGMSGGGGKMGAMAGMGGGGFGGPGMAGGSGGFGVGLGPEGPGGIPQLPGAGGSGGMLGGGMMGGDMMGGGMASPSGPEYSSALLWVYKKGKARLEFLINEDGRVAQISVAAPAKDVVQSVSSLRGPIRVTTSRGVSLGTGYSRVLSQYGFPEKTRRIPPGRFIESYYTKDYHAAFTTDAQNGNKVVRVTITLAD